MNVLVVGPSGVGKTTLINTLDGMDVSGLKLRRVISTTTRAPRPGEQDGVHYHFVTREAFEADKSNYIGPTEYRGNQYGMHKSHLVAGQGEVLIYATDIEGVRAAKMTGSMVLSVGMIAEMSILKQRLSGRDLSAERQEGIEAEQDEIIQSNEVDRLLYAGGSQLDVLSRAVNMITAYVELEQTADCLADEIAGALHEMGLA